MCPGGATRGVGPGVATTSPLCYKDRSRRESEDGMAAARPASRCVPLLVVSGLFLLSGLACGGRGGMPAGLGAAGGRLGDARAAAALTVGNAGKRDLPGVSV